MENIPKNPKTTFFLFELLSTICSMLIIIAIVICELYTYNIRIVPLTFYAGYWTSPFILFTAVIYSIEKSRQDGKFYKLAISFALFSLLVCLIGIMLSLFTIYWIIDIIDAQVYYEYRVEIIVQTALLILASGICLIDVFSLTCCCCSNVSTVSKDTITHQNNLRTHSKNTQQLPTQITNVTDPLQLHSYPQGYQVNQGYDQNYSQPNNFPPPYS
ncbi:unnamed protein product [Schistosoma mattheei]|uniref:Uncharacterized protein n=2 Tax=Schistosoma mattheei TaxID=31246 RepID=A0AA85B8N0_9TREM|nr:unnamed protein product [Schistosoma mattheei]